jgi:hypothetical protein
MLIEGAAAVIDQYNALFTRIEELELINVVDERTLLDVSLSMVYGFYPWQITYQGREVVKLLEAKPGQWTGQVLARVLEWQLDHPKATKDDCTKWLLQEQQAGRITVPPAPEPTPKKMRIRKWLYAPGNLEEIHDRDLKYNSHMEYRYIIYFHFKIHLHFFTFPSSSN